MSLLACFALAAILVVGYGFLSSGATPAEVGVAAQDVGGWFPVIADFDPLSPDSVTDMSGLIEAPAGERGFLRCDGKDLRFGDGTGPVRFWGVGMNLPREADAEAMEHRARWLRKLGVNAVRQHTMIDAVGLLGPDGFDAQRLDRYDRWFAALKGQGIYSTWSVVYPHHEAFLRRDDLDDPQLFAELDEADESHDGRTAAIAVNDYINLEEQIQVVVWRYFRALLEHRNPYTGLRYVDDPALAVVEFQNESNVFFHTLNGLRSGEPQRLARSMRQRWFRFATTRYGDRESVEKAWGGLRDRDDAWDRGELGLMAAFHWGADGPLYEFEGQQRRCADFIRFLADLQRDYYGRRERQLRELGFRGVTVATAWKGVGASSLANLWCDSTAGMIDRHNYSGGGAGRHTIVAGAVDRSTHLARPGRGLLGVGLFQLADRPFSVSEWTMMPPNPWKAEAAPLYAFYGMGLQGWDASYHFDAFEGRLGDGWPRLRKYSSETPHYFGQFPALAFSVLRGHVREAPLVALRAVDDAAIFAGKDALGQSLGDGDHDVKELGEGSLTRPEWLARGRVAVAFGAGAQTLIDVPPDVEAGQVIEAVTGELRWRADRRIVEVRSPKTQAIIGFAGGETIELPAVQVEMRTGFCSLIFTPLDDAPLAESKRVLITALARDRQSGGRFSDDGRELLEVGAPPLLLEPVHARIRFEGAAPRRVEVLDVYGVPSGEGPEIGADGSFELDGSFRTYLYLVTR